MNRRSERRGKIKVIVEDCFRGLAAIVIVAFLSAPVSALEVPHHVVISEVYVNAIDEFNSEWIELFNPTNEGVDISGWKINIKAYQPDATIPSPVTIPPHGFYLIGDKNWNTDNSSWCIPDHRENITLGNADSWINLTNSTGVPIDTVGWGAATINETLSFSENPQENKSIEGNR